MAAGLGFKTFTTGEVLSATDVNGYLMQGINVFANTTARDAAITSPQEGQFAYTKDTNSLWYYTGSAWAASGAAGDIEGVTAGTGLSGGGTSGTVTLAFDYAVGNQAIENAQTGTTYTLALSDAGKMVTLTNASAITLTIPTNASVAFPVNTRIDLLQYGAGQVTISGAGVTIYSSGSKTKLTGQYSGASLWKKATDTWVLIGDITA